MKFIKLQTCLYFIFNYLLYNIHVLIIIKIVYLKNLQNFDHKHVIKQIPIVHYFYLIYHINFSTNFINSSPRLLLENHRENIL